MGDARNLEAVACGAIHDRATPRGGMSLKIHLAKLEFPWILQRQFDSRCREVSSEVFLYYVVDTVGVISNKVTPYPDV